MAIVSGVQAVGMALTGLSQAGGEDPAPVVSQEDGEAAGGVLDQAQRGVELAGSLLERLPWEAHALTAVALVTGLLLWLFGRKLAKGAVGGTFAVVGAMIGLLVVPPLLGPSLIGMDSAYIGLAAGALLGLGIGLTTLKWAVVVKSGATFAMVGLVASLVYVHMTGPGNPGGAGGEAGVPEGEVAAADEGGNPIDKTLRDAAEAGLDDARDAVQERLDDLLGTPEEAEEGDGSFGDVAGEQLRRAGAQVRAVVSDGATMLGEAWRGLSAMQQRIVVISTFAGFVTGVVIGLTMPKRSTALVTSMTGAAIWISALGSLLEAFGVESGRVVAVWREPDLFAAAWIIATLLGWYMQTIGLERMKRKRQAKKEGKKKG